MKRKLSALFVSIAVGLAALAGCTSSPQVADSPSPTATTEVTLYVVRHGRTMLNTTDRVQGWADAPLTTAGIEVVKAAGRGLKDVKFDAAYSSDSGRAVETATLILGENKASEVTLATDARLREFNFGTWEGDLNRNMISAVAADQGVTAEEYIKAVTPENYANTIAKLDAERPESANNLPAEDYATVTKRLSDGVSDIITKETAAGHKTVLIVSHGLSISTLFDAVTEGYAHPEGGLKNASVSILKYANGKFALESLNDVSYIEKGKA